MFSTKGSWPVPRLFTAPHVPHYFCDARPLPICLMYLVACCLCSHSTPDHLVNLLPERLTKQEGTFHRASLTNAERRCRPSNPGTKCPLCPQIMKSSWPRHHPHNFCCCLYWLCTWYCIIPLLIIVHMSPCWYYCYPSWVFIDSWQLAWHSDIKWWFRSAAASLNSCWRCRTWDARRRTLLSLHPRANADITISTCYGFLQQLINHLLWIYSAHTQRNLLYRVVFLPQRVSAIKVRIHTQYPDLDFVGNSLLSGAVKYTSQHCPAKNNADLLWDCSSEFVWSRSRICAESGTSHAGCNIVQHPLVGDACCILDKICNRTTLA